VQLQEYTCTVDMGELTETADKYRNICMKDTTRLAGWIFKWLVNINFISKNLIKVLEYELL
jgi:hypothetical protein